MNKDITTLVKFEWNDDDHLPLTQCACGQRFAPWDFVLGIEPDFAKECPSCGRKLFFSCKVTVYEVVEEE